MRKFKKGKVIIRQGARGTTAYFIEKGKVEISREDAEGNKDVISILKKDEIFGEMALVAGWPRTATAIALEDCELRVLTRKEFQKLPETDPGVQYIRKIMDSRVKENKEYRWVRK